MLDTNILVSACWKPGGLEARTVELALSGRVLACATAAVWREYETIFERRKFEALRGASAVLIGALRNVVVMVEPDKVDVECGDPKDWPFVECAAGARAEFLITGNRKHYPLRCGTAEVVNAREFLDRLGPAQP